ncbi:MAG: DUF1289 domain-containing protein [Rhodobacteraceae bacterium]|nr:DUF1289 domain-containing protein [Paracoccaceae bacterium]
MDEVWRRAEVMSPCIKTCVIHSASGLCMGCLRSTEEISRWNGMNASERHEIMAALPARAPQIKGQRRGRRKKPCES